MPCICAGCLPPLGSQGSSPRERVHAAPALLSSWGPPINAVLPSEDSATLAPNQPLPASLVPASCLDCWSHVEPAGVRIEHGDPARWPARV
jgi:hypothetical protein